MSKAISARLESAHFVGAAVAIVRHGVVRYARGFGVRDRTTGAPVDANTRFEIGSNTKQFTAAAILQLEERKRLGLDDELSRYVPAFPHAREITVRQLLDQTTGLNDYVRTNHFVRIAQSSTGTLAKIERMVDVPLHFSPGSRWEYSNTNYVALGRVIEVVAGQSYRSYLDEHIFRLAGMDHTTTMDGERFATDMATGYWRRSDEAHLTAAPTIGAAWAGAAGEIVSTVGDIAKWDAALESGRIVARKDFDVMTRSATLSNGTRDDYGFGWWTDALRGHRRVYHDGDTFGMSANNSLFPDDDLAIVVLENEGSDAAARTAAAIFSLVERPQKRSAREPPRRFDR